MEGKYVLAAIAALVIVIICLAVCSRVNDETSGIDES